MKFVFSTTLALALLATAPALAEDTIDVMTQNQYLGADLTPIIAAPDAEAFNAALIVALEQIAANDYRSRAKSLAKLIANRLPELVGLQEMYAFTCEDAPGTPLGRGCHNNQIRRAFNDHLEETLEALDELDEGYVNMASVQNLNITLPVDLDFDGLPDIFVTVLDRDVILAREDIAGSVVPVPYSAFCGRPSADEGPGCNYTVVAEANTALGPIKQERGWVGVDATVRGKGYRFVNTHLEVQRPDPTNPLSPVVQAAQSGELIQILAATTPSTQSLIVVGDINSSADDPIIPGPLPLPPPFNAGIIPPYRQFVLSGYTDAWTLRPIPRLGFTCCQLSDLSNSHSILKERIDVIFSLAVPDGVTRARVLGARKGDKTWPPLFGQRLWPSDHASVAAELRFE
jgi:hypothetical protein